MTLPKNPSINNQKGPSQKTIKEFCELTSLHGIGFLYQASTITRRLFWITAIIGLQAVGTYFLIVNTESYINSRLVTNIESSTANLSVSK